MKILSYNDTRQPMSSITQDAEEGMHNCRKKSADLYLSRSVSAQGCESVSPHKIAVFSRKSLAITGFKPVQDLESYAFCDLDQCVSTAKLFSQDDCLHTELLPIRSLVHGSSHLGRARYNFQQGLLNTKEVLDIRSSQ
jgi:hypothetical protein